MPTVELSDAELEALIAYIKSQGAAAQRAPVQKAQS